ncbi:MAG: hypothetical protein M3245_05450, partial [Actinomycetota bacterium]|nr:hypothetical protein [Actinomycetota bacterium]
MRRKTIGRGLVVAVASLAVLALPAAAEPLVAITSPEDGATFSRSQTPRITVTGISSFDTPEPSEVKFNLRRTACEENKRL